MLHSCFEMPIYANIQVNDYSTFLIEDNTIRDIKNKILATHKFSDRFKWNYCPYCGMKLEKKK